MPKLKEKFFNKPDTLTQEKKSLGEAIKSGGMLKSAKRKKGVKTDTEKEALMYFYKNINIMHSFLIFI